jgi:hypothetical protein
VRYHSGTAIKIISITLFLTIVSLTGIANAQGKFEAQYTISMIDVPIGHIVWFAEIGDKHYSTSANGNASGVLSILMNGEGAVGTHGSVVNGQLAPIYYTSRIIDDDGKTELQMTFSAGGLKELITLAPPLQPVRVPVTDTDRRGVFDPLTAMLIPVGVGENVLSSANCNHVLAIFDGQRRYNLALSFRRMDEVNIPRGYSGPALVCGVILQPIAGYRADSMLVKYIAGRRDIELWFVPIAGTSIIVPIRVLIPTLIGALKIQSDRFETTASVVFPTP